LTGYRQNFSAHSSLQKFFTDDPDPTLKRLGTDLLKLHIRRVKCDYKDPEITEGKAQFSVTFAKSIIGRIPTV
jgi:hypothetical protein